MKKLLSMLVLGSLIYFSILEVYAIERIYGGPRSIEEAKEKFFKGKKLDIIEGIWYEKREAAMYAVVKSKHGVYDIWTIEHKMSKYEGTRDKHESLRKTASNKVYTFETTIYDINNPSEEAVGTGTWILSNVNFVDVNIIRGCWSTGKCWPPIDAFYMRIWPENINDSDSIPEPNGGQLVSGTGFFINKKGYVITNSHVIDGCKTEKKILHQNISKDFELVAEDESLDLALLKTNMKNKNYLKITKKEVGKLDKIIVAGFPFGKFLNDDLKFTEGIVSSLKGFQGASHEMQIDAAINSGNSGGPVVNENGELVGIAVATLSKEVSEGINFAIKSSSLEIFLKSNSFKVTKSGYSFGNFDRAELRELLENSTVYISCKL